MAEIGKDIFKARDMLEKGEVIGIPTETVYGLAANALNENAVVSIFKIKERPFFDPLIIHLPSIQSVEKYAELSDARLLKLARAIWPGPLTLVLQKKEIIPDIVTSGLPNVAVRIPNHTLSLELLKNIDFPLAAPSANPFGYVSPTEARHVNRQLGDKIRYILDGGACEVGLESTIVGVEEDSVCVYRLGGLAIESIEQLIGKVEIRVNQSSNPKAPGQLKNHYSPHKPLYIGNIENLLKERKETKVAILHFGEKEYRNHLAFNLSKRGDLDEAAIHLFKYLRLADESEAEIVICEWLPEQGLGRAINDRLKRASAQNQ